MLETRNTFAEQLIQKIKKDREKNKIDYVHPRNQIEDGFIVVNYRKRNVIYRELFNGNILFPVLEEWEALQIQDDLCIYGFKKEKQLLEFKVTEHALDAGLERDWDKRDSPYMREETIETKTGLRIDCKMFMGTDHTFAVVFAVPYHNVWIQGTFLAHGFRKKYGSRLFHR